MLVLRKYAPFRVLVLFSVPKRFLLPLTLRELNKSSKYFADVKSKESMFSFVSNDIRKEFGENEMCFAISMYFKRAAQLDKE